MKVWTRVNLYQVDSSYYKDHILAITLSAPSTSVIFTIIPMTLFAVTLWQTENFINGPISG